MKNKNIIENSNNSNRNNNNDNIINNNNNNSNSNNGKNLFKFNAQLKPFNWTSIPMTFCEFKYMKTSFIICLCKYISAN